MTQPTSPGITWPDWPTGSSIIIFSPTFSEKLRLTLLAMEHALDTILQQQADLTAVSATMVTTMAQSVATMNTVTTRLHDVETSVNSMLTATTAQGARLDTLTTSVDGAVTTVNGMRDDEGLETSRLEIIQEEFGPMTAAFEDQAAKFIVLTAAVDSVGTPIDQSALIAKLGDIQTTIDAVKALLTRPTGGSVSVKQP